jgi:hypothetical protein
MGQDAIIDRRSQERGQGAASLEAEQQAQARLAAKKQSEKIIEQPPVANPSADLKGFAGVYRDRWYQDLQLLRVGDSTESSP